MATQLVPEKNRECLDACTDCVAACEACAQHCIDSAQQEMVSCVKQYLDCATLCQACVTLLGRDSQYLGQGVPARRRRLMCQCAQACPRTANACRAMAP